MRTCASHRSSVGGSRATHRPLPAGFERSRQGRTEIPELRVFLTWLRFVRPLRCVVLKLGRVGTRSRLPLFGLQRLSYLLERFMQDHDDHPPSSSRLLEDAA